MAMTMRRGGWFCLIPIAAAWAGPSHAQTPRTPERVEVRAKAAARTTLSTVRSQSRLLLVKRYGEALVSLAESSPGTVAQQNHPMLGFFLAGSLTAAQGSNRFDFCYDVKNFGMAPSAPASLNVIASPGAESALPVLTMVQGSSTVAIPSLAPGAHQKVCGFQSFKEIPLAAKVSFDSTPRFLATIAGELNQGKTASLHPMFFGALTGGSSSVPASGPMLAIVQGAANTDSASNVIRACAVVQNKGPGAATGTPSVQVKVTLKGVTTTTSVPLPLLAPGEKKTTCTDLAVQGMTENRFGATSLQDGLRLVWSLQGGVNDGSGSERFIEYVSVNDVVTVP